tara:strand:+ start:522 stop:704 length:183 start_codon:yes stop_codon:yes gene_type:complete
MQELLWQIQAILNVTKATIYVTMMIVPSFFAGYFSAKHIYKSKPRRRKAKRPISSAKASG